MPPSLSSTQNYPPPRTSPRQSPHLLRVNIARAVTHCLTAIAPKTLDVRDHLGLLLSARPDPTIDFNATPSSGVPLVPLFSPVLSDILHLLFERANRLPSPSHLHLHLLLRSSDSPIQAFFGQYIIIPSSTLALMASTRSKSCPHLLQRPDPCLSLSSPSR